ncbi:hypothetical protein ASD65_06040 [Microbacterium sp. Root61]|uniref:sensor histidine kinase n=1 Tax=Microbacterium sp. Root61 TaxID=1736570 RepID=UPI0006F7D154|nr:ATP-binding protein [Microbacterium sp. Root61]KRA24030.1 hypothetical protein ASD65_06040 [Microbacterium sp. Root61]
MKKTEWMPQPAADRRDDRRVFLLTAGALLVTFSLGATLQAVFVFRPERLSLLDLAADAPLLPHRFFANLLAVAVVLGVSAAVRLNELRTTARIVSMVVLAVSVAVLRHMLQLALGIYSDPPVEISTVEIASVAVIVFLSLAIAVVQVQARGRLRVQERTAAAQRQRASAALAELTTEEVRVRREVAEGLHGTLQGRLVMSQARVAGMLRRGRSGGWSRDALGELEELQQELEDIRERDIRELSQLIYPVGVDVSVAHSVHTLVRRIPADIAVVATISPEVDRALGGAAPDVVSERIAIVRAVEEGTTNALRHGAATEIRIDVRLVHGPEMARTRVRVDDDGVGIPESPRWNGLKRIAERLEVHGGRVELTASPLGGARLEVELDGGRGAVAGET